MADTLNPDDPGGVPPRPLHLRRRLLAAASGVVAWLVFRGLSLRPELAERVVGTGPIAEFPRLLSLATGLVPFALAEFVVIGILLRQASGAWGGMRDLRAGREPGSRVALRGGLRLAQDIGVLVLLFYLLWGFQYARPGVEAGLGLPERGPIPSHELAEVSAALVGVTNALYRGLHGGPDRGTPTPAPPIRSLVPALEEGWEGAADRWSLSPRVTRRHGAPRGFLLTPVVRRFAIAGMYFPFTGEALVMRDLPGAARGRDLAHEMAHQRGIASESDANTLAYLVSIAAPDPHLRYAGALFLQRQLLGELSRVDPDAAEGLVRSRVPGVQRDVDDLHAYWLRSRGRVGEIAGRMNDAMLRSHGIPEGVASYGGSVWVVVSLARREGLASVLPDAPGAPELPEGSGLNREAMQERLEGPSPTAAHPASSRTSTGRP